MTPTPFQILLGKASKDAQKDPIGAFARVDELYGKTTTEDDIMQLCAFSTNLGVVALGKYKESEDLLNKMLTHPVLAETSPVVRSINRALSVICVCQNRNEEAAELKEKGVFNASEQCRFAIMCAQTLIARQQTGKAVPYLKQSASLSQELADNDPVLQMVSQISLNVQSVAEQQLQVATDLLSASSNAAYNSTMRSDDWRVKHTALFHRSRSNVLSRNPESALNAVGKMIELEKENDATPFESFHSALAASYAQLLRGQVKIAIAARDACSMTLKEIENSDRKEQLQKSLDALNKYIKQMMDRKNNI